MKINSGCKIISHRGMCRIGADSQRIGENTLEAFDSGIKKLGLLGYPKAIEFDVRLTKDGVPVVIHDELVDRTTNGRGLVRSYAASEIQKLDAGYGRKIPLLSEVLNAFKNSGVIFNIELKERGLVEIVKRLVFSENVQVQTIISAFDEDDADNLDEYPEYYSSWRDLRQIGESLPIALLATDKKIKKIGGIDNYIKAAINAKAIAINPEHTSVSEELVAAAHKAGLKVNSYTVNDVKTFAEFNRMGVDNIFSDNPEFLNVKDKKY